MELFCWCKANNTTRNFSDINLLASKITTNTSNAIPIIFTDNEPLEYENFSRFSEIMVDACLIVTIPVLYFIFFAKRFALTWKRFPKFTF